MPESAIAIRGFQGLNIREEPATLKDSELSECYNMDLQPGGQLTKRFGIRQLQAGLGANNIRMLGHFFTGAISKLLISTGAKVYWSTDGVNWTELLLGGSSIANVFWGVQYVNNFYLIRSSSTIVQWDGTTTSALAGSPTGDFAVIHKERMFVLNSQASGTGSSRLYFSGIGNPASWGGSDFIDIKPGDGEPLIGAIVLQDTLLIFKLNTTWALHVQGTTSDWVVRQPSTSIGCTSKYTLREIDGLIYFVSVRGVYVTDGVSFKSISDNIDPVFKSRLVTPSSINLDSAAWWDDKYIVVLTLSTVQGTWSSYSSFTWDQKASTYWGSSSIVFYYYVYHTKVGGWTRWDLTTAAITPWTFTEVRQDAPAKGLYAGDAAGAGKTFVYDTAGYIDGTATPITCDFSTKVFDFGQATLTKRGKWIGLDLEGFSSGTYVLTYTVDSGAPTDVSFSPTKNRGELKLKGPGFFRTIKYRVSIANTGVAAFYGFTMHTHVKRPMIPLSA